MTENTRLKKKKLPLVIVGAVVFLCVVCCTLGTIQSSTPEGKATATARAVERAAEAFRPTATPRPTNTPRPTATPRPTNTLNPTNTPKPTNTVQPSSTPTATPINTPTPTASPLPATAIPVPPISVGESIEIHFIDVGQGDAILVRGAGAAVLIDGGEQGSATVNYLRSIGVQHLDAVVATHPHADHIGGLIDVLRAIPVDTVITNGQPHTTLTYERFLDAIIAGQIDYREVTRGEKIQAGGLTFHVLHPVSPTGPNLNEQSIVLRLDHHQVSVLFTGDIESGTEANLVASGQRLQAQILKVPHHASRSSSTQAFLQNVRPEIAIYCAGTGNRYEHPHAETLAALGMVGATIYGTDVNRTIVVTIDGQTYQVSVVRGTSVQPAPTVTSPTVTPKPVSPTATPKPISPTATPKPVSTTAPPPVQDCPYIGNRNTMVFHRAGCHSINRMAEHNKVCLQSRDDAIAQGYRPCKNCNP